jgi:hypothetical protein
MLNFLQAVNHQTRRAAPRGASQFLAILFLVSLAPGFSRVISVRKNRNGFNRFRANSRQAVETAFHRISNFHRAEARC